MSNKHNTRPTDSSIPGVEAGDTIRNITHSAHFLTNGVDRKHGAFARGTDEQYNARLAEATARYDKLSGREL